MIGGIRMNWNRRDLIKAGLVAGAAVPVAVSPGRVAAQDVAWAQRKRKLRVRGIDMAYVEVGSGDPIVFLHGNPTSSSLWRNVIPHVEHLGRCIAPDMVGMGDSDPLPDSGPGAYKFATHRDYMFALLEELGVTERAIFVVHDWGSGIGFSWGQRNTSGMRGLAFMEAIIRPPAFPPTPAPTGGPFATFRSSEGEEAVLENNLFVEQLLIQGLAYYLTEEDKAEYRRPYLEPGESRRPTLAWPRELPMDGEPADTEALVRSYTEWLETDTRVPKLFVRANPGAIFSNPMILEYVRGFSNQTEVMVYGGHYVQEISPHAIGRALADWISGLA
jgi:haloalkane dehalogenase